MFGYKKMCENNAISEIWMNQVKVHLVFHPAHEPWWWRFLPSSIWDVFELLGTSSNPVLKLGKVNPWGTWRQMKSKPSHLQAKMGYDARSWSKSWNQNSIWRSNGTNHGETPWNSWNFGNLKILEIIREIWKHNFTNFTVFSRTLRVFSRTNHGFSR